MPQSLQAYHVVTQNSSFLNNYTGYDTKSYMPMSHCQYTLLIGSFVLNVTPHCEIIIHQYHLSLIINHLIEEDSETRCYTKHRILQPSQTQNTSSTLEQVRTSQNTNKGYIVP